MIDVNSVVMLFHCSLFNHGNHGIVIIYCGLPVVELVVDVDDELEDDVEEEEVDEVEVELPPETENK